MACAKCTVWIAKLREQNRQVGADGTQSDNNSVDDDMNFNNIGVLAEDRAVVIGNN